MQLQPGTVIDRYQVVALLGRGGMALVYLVRHERLGTLHAMKVLAVPTMAIRERLLVEGRTQAHLQHPNIVNVTDLLDAHGSPGLIMEYVEGPTLDAVLRAGPLALGDADALARGIMDGVEAAHRVGLVHRDLKPGNVLLRVHEDGLTPKVTDFGLVKVLASDAAPSATRSGATMGTPAYMPPEQIRDASRVDARADVWALGALLYELVTGRKAFDATDTIALFDDIAAARFVAPRELVPDLPERMEQAIVAALVPDRERRTSTVAALAATWRGSSAPPRCDVAMVARARAAYARPAHPTTPPSDETLPEEGPFAALPTVQPTAIPPLLPAPSMPAPPVGAARGSTFSTAARGIAGLLFGLAVAAAAGWLWVRRPSEPVLTAQRVPELCDDSVAQDHLRRGWDALLAADPTIAERDLAIAAAREPNEPVVGLALVAARRLLGDTRSVQDLEQIAPIVAGRDDVAKSLYQVAMASASDGALARDALAAHLERWPDDALASILVYGHYRWADQEARLEVIDAALAADPGPALPFRMRGQVLDALGRFDEAVTAFEAGLGRAPGSVPIRRALGESQLAAGRFEEARDSLRGILSDAADPETRGSLAIAHLHLGEDDAADVQRRILLDPVGPAGARREFALTWAEARAGLGRPTAALEEIAAIAQEAVADDAYQDGVFARMRSAYLASLLGRPEVVREQVTELRVLIAAPDVPLTFRAGISGMTLVFEVYLAALEGRGGDADVLVDRLVRANEPQARVQHARIWADVARRDTEALRAGLDGTCDQAWLAASYLDRGGDPAARRGYERVTRPEICRAWGVERALRAAAHVRLALLAADQAPEEARRQLALFDASWPAPDEDEPLVREARALARRLGGAQ